MANGHPAAPPNAGPEGLVRPAAAAALFGPPDPATARRATVVFGSGSLEILWEGGARLARTEEVRLSLGGLDGDRLVVETGEGEGLLHLQLDLAAFAPRIGEVPDPALRARLAALAPRAAERKSRAATLGFRMAGMLAALLLALYLAWNPLLDVAVARIPPAWERSLGQSAATHLLAGRVEVTTGEAKRDLDALFARLVAKADAPECEFRLHLVRDDEVNAFALPGGTVVVHTALLSKSGRAEEVAGVLAHEIQHAKRRHGMRRIVGGLGAGALAAVLIGDVGSLGGLMQRAALELGLKSYDRDQEREADAGAVELLATAGIDPHPFANFFDRLHAEGAGLPQALGWFSTHPASDERAATVRALAERAAAGRRFIPLPYRFSDPAPASVKGTRDGAE